MSTRWTESDLADHVRRNPRALRVNPLSPAAAKPSKYRNIPTELDGIRFASKREATRYKDLKARERFGLIQDLKLQVLYPLTVNGQKVGNYRSDFDYTEDGQKIVEDCKGCKTPMYRLKKKLMRAIYNIEIRET